MRTSQSAASGLATGRSPFDSASLIERLRSTVTRVLLWRRSRASIEALRRECRHLRLFPRSDVVDFEAQVRRVDFVCRACGESFPVTTDWHAA